MPLEPLHVIDTRPLFRPVASGLVVLLRGLPPAAWELPTVAGAWVVRDVVAHMIDTSLRRLSFHRDGMAPPPSSRAIASERDFVNFINDLNAQWVAAAKRMSPRVLTDLYARASGEAADWFEALSLDAPALFPVSWAGEEASAGWFDIGREFTELWHHQQQIRMAVGAAPLDDPTYLAAVLDVAVRGLPHAFRDVAAGSGSTVAIDVSGPSGGRWTLCRDAQRWRLWRGMPEEPTARIRLGDEDAWKLLFNALPERDATAVVRIDGDVDLGRALLRARSVVV
jgi:uncharacterized protein (TIGR03083 family)